MKKAIAIGLMLVAGAALGEYNQHDVPAWDDAYAPFSTSKNMTNRSTITWQTVADTTVACNAVYQKYYNQKFATKVNACSFWQRENNGEYTCTIITKKTTTMHTLGHEVRHCFEDRWHTW